MRNPSRIDFLPGSRPDRTVPVYFRVGANQAKQGENKATRLAGWQICQWIFNRLAENYQ